MPRCVGLRDVIHDLVEAKLQYPPFLQNQSLRPQAERPAEGYGARVVTTPVSCRRQAHVEVFALSLSLAASQA